MKKSNPIEQKIAEVKEIIKKLDAENVKEKFSEAQVTKIFSKIVMPIKQAVKDYYKSSVLSDWFDQLEITTSINELGSMSDRKLKEILLKNSAARHFTISVNLNGFKYAGIHAFTCWKQLNIFLGDYTYLVVGGHKEVDLFEALYHNLPIPSDFDTIVNYIVEQLLDQTKQQLERIK